MDNEITGSIIRVFLFMYIYTGRYCKGSSIRVSWLAQASQRVTCSHFCVKCKQVRGWRVGGGAGDKQHGEMGSVSSFLSPRQSAALSRDQPGSFQEGARALFA